MVVNAENGSTAESKDPGAVEGVLRPSSRASTVIIFGVIVVILIFGVVGIWSATAPLARAVSAPALLVVRGERKQIQHLEGGIVSEVLVTDGEFVKRDQLLLRLDPLQAGATVSRFHNELDRALVLESRLKAELNGEDGITLNNQLLERAESSESVLDIIEAEQKQFVARRETFLGHIGILRQRVDQFHKEILGLKIQRQARVEQLEIFAQEIVGLRDLYEKGYFPRSKILAMERAMVGLGGALGSDDASIARASSAKGEAEKQIINVTQRFREDVTGKLRDIQAQIADLEERILVAKDILQRIDIRAPRSGIVQALQVHTIGGIVRSGQILLEIVPQDEDLVIEAHVSPVDIDSIAIGQKAEVMLTALDIRSTPTIYGSVKSISGDSLVHQQTGLSYFLALVEIPHNERIKLGDAKLSPGMPAEVLINTGQRTLLEYVIKPIRNSFKRGLNEE